MDRKSINRDYILDILRNSSDHPTAIEIFEKLRVDLPHISLGTVYRNLNFLERKGLIKKLDFGYSQRRYDGNTEKHYHIRCIYCDHLQDIPCDTANPLLRRITETTGFKEIQCNIEYTGICMKCYRILNKS